MIGVRFYLSMAMHGSAAIALVESVRTIEVEKADCLGGEALPGEDMVRAARSLGLRTASTHDCEWQM